MGAPENDELLHKGNLQIQIKENLQLACTGVSAQVQSYWTQGKLQEVDQSYGKVSDTCHGKQQDCEHKLPDP